MKNLNKFFMLIAVSLMALTACSDDLEQVELTPDEYPRIIGNWPMKADDGALGTYSFAAGDTLKINLMFTPSQYAVGTWYVDDVEYSTGNSFMYTNNTPGEHYLKLILKTAKNETFREATIVVREPVLE